MFACVARHACAWHTRMRCLGDLPQVPTQETCFSTSRKKIFLRSRNPGAIRLSEDLRFKDFYLASFDVVQPKLWKGLVRTRSPAWRTTSPCRGHVAATRSPTVPAPSEAPSMGLLPQVALKECILPLPRLCTAFRRRITPLRPGLGRGVPKGATSTAGPSHPSCPRWRPGQCLISDLWE